jgi:uncharacterized protein
MTTLDRIDKIIFAFIALCVVIMIWIAFDMVRYHKSVAHKLGCATAGEKYENSVCAETNLHNKDVSRLQNAE